MCPSLSSQTHAFSLLTVPRPLCLGLLMNGPRCAAALMHWPSLFPPGTPKSHPVPRPLCLGLLDGLPDAPQVTLKVQGPLVQVAGSQPHGARHLMRSSTAKRTLLQELRRCWLRRQRNRLPTLCEQGDGQVRIPRRSLLSVARCCDCVSTCFLLARWVPVMRWAGARGLFTSHAMQHLRSQHPSWPQQTGLCIPIHAQPFATPFACAHVHKNSHTASTHTSVIWPPRSAH